MQTCLNSWTCLPCAFAMVVGLTPKEFMVKIGHDGSDEPYEDLPGMKSGFHEQECIEVLQQMGLACTPIEIVPQMRPTPSGPVRSVWFPPAQLTVDPEDSYSLRESWNLQRLRRHLICSNGVFTGVNQKPNHEVIGHAVAWDGFEVVIYDPRGQGYKYNFEHANDYGFSPQVYWKVQKI